MTVREMIASLQKFDGDLEIDISDNCGGSYSLYGDDDFEVVKIGDKGYLCIK